MFSPSAIMMENCGTKSYHTRKLSEDCQGQKYVDSEQVKTESDEDPIWACYASGDKQECIEASGVKTEPLWVKSEALEFDESRASSCGNFLSVPFDQKVLLTVKQTRDSALPGQTVVVKNEDHFWESYWDCYNSVPGNENQRTESDIKQENVTIKQECYAAPNLFLTNTSQTNPSPVVRLPQRKDNQRDGNLSVRTASEIPLSSNPVTNMTHKQAPQSDPSFTKPHLLQPRASNQLHPPSPGHERAGENKQVCLFCQHCKKTMRSHCVEGSEHKIPKTTKVRNNVQIRNWKCCQCDVAFGTTGRLVYHLTKVHSRSSLPCGQCDMSFNCKQKRAYHRKCEHEAHVSCEECGKVYRSVYHLKVHQRSHREELIKHFCELCGKGFRLKAALHIHMSVHTEERLYKCPDCKATFKAELYLARHRIIHTDLKPFSCDVCQNKFRRKSNLRAHLTTHNKDPVKETGKRKKEMLTGKTKKVQLSESEEEEEEWEKEEKEEDSEDQEESDEICDAAEGNPDE